jgi:tetratricopeptide (TPR) repeat protein
VATGLYNLANLLVYKEDYAGAEPLYRRAWEIYEQEYGCDNRYTLKTCDNIAWVMARTNNRPKAIELLKQYIENTNAEEDELESLRYNLSCYECLEGNLDEAKRLIKLHLHLHPNQKTASLDDKDLTAIKEFIENISTT